MPPTIQTASPTNGVSGVVLTPPSNIRGSIKAAVAEVIATIPPGKKAVVEIAVALETGVNVVYAFKGANGKWTVASWLGSNWSGKLAGGAQITRAWA